MQNTKRFPGTLASSPGRFFANIIWRVFSVKIGTLIHNFDEVGQKLYEVGQLVYEVGQSLDGVGQLLMGAIGASRSGRPTPATRTWSADTRTLSVHSRTRGKGSKVYWEAHVAMRRRTRHKAYAGAPANYSFVPRLFPSFFHRYELSGHNLTDQRADLIK